MFTTKSLLIIACIVVSTSLFGQPITDQVLLTAPTITETMNETEVISTYIAPTPTNENVWVLPPTGTKLLTTAGKLAVLVDSQGQTGTYRFYFPLSGLRANLIVE